MLYYLLYHVLQRYFSPLNVFRYITVRTVYASLTAMFLALVFGPWLIRKLRELQIGQFIREEGPQEHKKKAGTPTKVQSNRFAPVKRSKLAGFDDAECRGCRKSSG